MRHCSQFKADDIYYLTENEIYTNRILSIGFCPVCKRPVAELIEYNFAGGMNKITVSGIHAQNLMVQLKSDIVYSVRELNFKKLKSKPYGWKFGVNKESKNGKISQYACDFYGNKELVKKIVG